MKKKKPVTPDQKTDTNQIAESLERYRPYLAGSELLSLTAEIEQPLLPAIRANCLKTNPISAIDEWQRLYGWEIKKIPYYPYGWQIVNSERPISQTVEHRMGEYYIQDAASMLPVAMFDIENQPGQFILDMAASPGGKTTQLVDLTGDRSFVLANDSSTSRLQALRIVLQNWGAVNYFSTNFAGEKLGEWFPETFDVILLDAPCSMENLRPSPTHPLRPITVSERHRLSQRQSNLLISAFKALKPGGQLVYATCTLAPEEDEAVLDFLLRTHPSQTEIIGLNKLNFHAPGLSEFNGIQYNASVKNALRLWPHILGTSGFFAARIGKKSSLALSNESAPARDFSLTGLVEINAREASAIQSSLSDAYGLNLEKILEKYQLAIFRRNDMLFLLPLRYLTYFQSLPFHTLGMILAKYSGSSLILSQEFISRFGRDFSRGFITIEDELVHGWLSGRDIRNFNPPSMLNGSIVLVKDFRGRILGSGKILAGRVRNLLPKRLI